ncbi:MAG TPA: UDP-N-acetylmuramate dehydrogenase [Bacteroidales bacterium]|nr:UDP-N-acetylmuramate dehydrogenase [Bacteroidales bacterium]
MYRCLASDLTALTTFGVPVKAREYCRVDAEAELEELFRTGCLDDPSLLVLGGGSNLLFVTDPPGMVLHPAMRGITFTEDRGTEVIVQCAAGEAWDDLVAETVAAGLSGLENLSLIPGSVGAAPVQNIGAYGVELKDVFHSLRAFDREDGRWLVLGPADCRFAYRRSVFKEELRERMIITSVSLKLSRGSAPDLGYGSIRTELDALGINNPGPAEVRAAVISIRQSKLPDPQVLGNAGSFFKNPEVDASTASPLMEAWPGLPSWNMPDGRVKLAAGWLIEKAGLKGFRLGNAGVHDRQALVLVNHGGASGAEILRLATIVKQTVKERFGILLEPEVDIIGGALQA